MKETCQYKLKLEKDKTFPKINLQKFEDVERFLIDDLKLNEEPEEVVILIAVNMNLDVAGIFEVSRGTIYQSQIYAGDILKRLLLTNCTRFMIAHNHPSGNTLPSINDDAKADELMKISKLLNFDMVDFLIVGDKVLSYKKEEKIH